MCNFEPNCPEGEDELACPSSFNFDYCETITDCGFSDDSPGFLVKSVEDIAIENLDPNGHGPSTNYTGGTEGKMVFMQPPQQELLEDTNPVVQMSTPHYHTAYHRYESSFFRSIPYSRVLSNSSCELQMWYYISGLTSNYVMANLNHAGTSGMPVEALSPPPDAGQYWRHRRIGIGERSQFNVGRELLTRNSAVLPFIRVYPLFFPSMQLSISLEIVPEYNASVALDQVDLVGCQPGTFTCGEDDEYVYQCPNGV